MKNKILLFRLSQQEKLLYITVEQLRTSLYLHDNSLIFQFFSTFYFAGQDIKNFCIWRGVKKISPILVKQKSILSLQSKIRWLKILSHTPYAWIIYTIYFFKRIVSVRQSKIIQANTKKSFLIFGSTLSSDYQSRSVQIALQLAKKNTVIYIEGIFDEGSRAGSRIVEKSHNFTAIRLTAKNSIHLNYQKPSPKEMAFLKKSFSRSNVSTFKRSNVTLYLHHPFWSFVIPLKKNTYYFDNSNDHSHTNAAGKHIIDAEKICLKNALIVTGPYTNLLRSKNDIVIKNGVDWNHFKDSSKIIETCDVGLCWIKKPVIGFIGTLDEKIDELLLGNLATAFPAASIVLVGNTDYRPVIEVAENYPNIFPVGKQPYEKLPLFLQSFDILIEPFKYKKSTIFVHPELPLYLASGKPIVATSTTAAITNGAIYQPRTHADWILAVAEALKEKKRSKKRFLRIAAAKKLAWKISHLNF